MFICLMPESFMLYGPQVCHYEYPHGVVAASYRSRRRFLFQTQTLRRFAFGAKWGYGIKSDRVFQKLDLPQRPVWSFVMRDW